MKDVIRVKGTVTVRLFGPDGRLKEQTTTENGITLYGFGKLVDCYTGGTGALMTHVGIGWGAGASTAFNDGQTDLQGANKNRAPTTPAVVSKIDNKNWKIVALWGPNNPSPTLTIPIEEIGTFTASSGANMVSRTVRAVVNKAPADSLEVTYNFALS